MPPLPRNLHLVTTPRNADIAIYKKHAARDIESAAPATQNEPVPVLKHSTKMGFADSPIDTAPAP